MLDSVPRFLLVLVTVWGAVAHAEPKPWAVGVSDTEQATALAIYQEANAEFEEARYAQALAKYGDAIKHWDHPSIRFNMVVCLINLDQPLEAFDDLERALKYGAQPFSADVFAQALTYQKLLLGQLARLQVTSAEPGAEVTLDGAKLFVAPGNVTKLVRPGDHQIVATKSGFLTATTPLVLVGGKVTVVDVRLVKIEPARIVRRWSPWKPWAIVSVGVALASTGGYLEWRAYKDNSSYSSQFKTACPSGCGGPVQSPIPASLVSLRDRARIENISAIAMLIVGGAALVTGSYGVYVNQPRAAGLEKNIMVTPTLGGVSLALVGSF